MRGARRAACLIGVATWSATAPASADDLPPGWKNGDAYAKSLDGEAARAAGLWEKCMEADLTSIQLEAHTTTRVHFAGCADRAGKVLAALRQLQVVLDAALASNDAEVATLARARVEQLLHRLPALTIDASRAVKDLAVTIDDVRVPPEQYGKPIPTDPGKHRVHADGTLEGAVATFDEVADLEPGVRTTVVIALRPRATEFLTPGQLSCMQLAKTQAEVIQCLPAGKKPLVALAALEMSTYADTFNVEILNPAVRGSIASPTAGWHVGASYLIDVITAASPDFISTASPAGHDTRHAGTVNGGYKPGLYGFEATGGYSTESDYVSRNGSLAVLFDVMEKRVTPRLSWSYSNDTITRGGTPASVYAHTLETHQGAASTSVILSPTSIIVVGGTATFERGDQSKPYRLIPMFAPGATLGRGASADDVNALRLAIRPYEQLPLERDRYAIGGRFMHRFTRGTLRLEERVYTDSWENTATSTDARFLIDFGTRVTAGPHARFTAQTGANFFHRVYYAQTEPTLVVPRFRTTDRELGPLWATTFGGSMWLRLTGEGAGAGLMLYSSADVLWSNYLNSIYAKDRLAGYGTVGLEAKFE